ncbi:MAG: GNAT family N-acetyltransferase [Tidjanibacter sp.]|nr:GNAT family N-acetyltransferase [Tidjanibacter sp.]
MIFLCDIASESQRCHAEQLYRRAFPKDERPDIEVVWKNLAQSDNGFEIKAVCDNNEMVGMVSYWLLCDFFFIEHLATNVERRGCGIGARVIEAIASTPPYRIVLEVEPPVDALSRRRVEFYRRNGFELSTIDYMQPAYSAERKSLPMRLMWRGNFDPEELLDAARTIRRRVYGICQQ